MLSTLIYPFVALALRKGSASPDGEAVAAATAG
jgi:hypothetical protein